MTYDNFLADRIKWILDSRKIAYTEKKMFGGNAFMVDDKMCLGIIKEKLMARIDPEFYDEALTKNACKPMDFTGKMMKGFVFVLPEGIELDRDLEFWVEKCLEYNPRAKATAKKKK
jgi:TfoX/Sxy family transcriptional regulator of competence genes